MIQKDKKKKKDSSGFSSATTVIFGGIASVALLATTVVTMNVSSDSIIPDNVDKNRGGVCAQAIYTNTNIISNKCIYLDNQEEVIEDPELTPDPETDGEDIIKPNPEPEPEPQPEPQPEPEPISPDTGIMRTTWDTSIDPKCTQITLPISGAKSDVTVDWGNGDRKSLFTDTSPVYETPGLKEIVIQGEFDKWGAEKGWDDAECIVEVKEWKDTGTTDLTRAFSRSNSLTRVAEIPETAEILTAAFASNQSNFDISNVRTPNATKMDMMFFGTTNFNKPITLNTSKVTDMSHMFYRAVEFNQPVIFDTSNVDNMQYMFFGTDNFDQPLNFNTSKVTNMQYMFFTTPKFNQPLNFDTSNVTKMGSMFEQATAFNQDLSAWNVSKVTSRYAFNTGAKNWTLPKPKFK